MKRNMFDWRDGMIHSVRKKALPLLSYPSIQIMGISVRDLISDSRKQAEGMRMIAERTDAAASVSMMDLSVEAECFGSAIRFSGGEVPNVVGGIVSSMEEARKLEVPKVGTGRTGIDIEAIREAAATITDRPVFAGVIGPFSLAGRLMDVSQAMLNCYDDPDMVKLLLDKATAFITEYGRAFKAAGANGIVMAEPLAGVLSPALSEEFSCTYVKQIVDAVQDENFIVVYHNCGNATIRMADAILATGAAAFHFGNAIKMSGMMPHIPAGIFAMGNVDPAGQFRNGTPASIYEATMAVLNECSAYPNFIISSGCDIPPLSKWENIDAFFKAVSDFYAHIQ